MCFSLSIKNLSKLSLTSDNSDVIEVLIERLGEELSPIEAGPDIVGGSTLPCHSDVHYSTLTQQCIQVCDSGWSFSYTGVVPWER